MGVRIAIGDLDYEATQYSVSEEATPTAITDSTGSVGTVTFNIKRPDPDLQPDHPILKYTEGWLEGQSVRLEDTRYGFTVGRVRSANYNADTQDIGIEVIPRIGEFNVFNVQAQPYVGTLSGAFVYYASLAGLTTDIAVDPEIADKPVVAPGFFGDLWANMKQFAAANECEIALVAGVIYLRRLRQQEVVKGRNFQRTRTIGGTQLAQAVEVYLYDTKPLNNELFYPSGGWNPEVPVLNVNAGETAEYTLEFDASIESFEEPVMVEWVDQDHDESSVYTIAADDSLPVPPQMWADRGGKVEFILNDDTTTITVKLTGPTGVPLATGGESRTFSLALAADETGSRYSTLRIVGTGVGWTKTKKRFRTAVPPERTATEIGVTIDNPFINDLETLYRTGSQAAKQFTGMNFEVTGIVSAVTDRGEGSAPTPTYGDIQDEFEGQTYAQVETWYNSQGYDTYAKVLAYWVSTMADLFSSQIFGRVQGARAWDRDTRRWFRIRQASITPESLSFTMAEDDLTYGDMQTYRDTMTYGDVQQLADAGSLTYAQERMAGAYA